MILILVRFMQIGRARESWQIYHKALARFMDLPALACKSNLHEPHQNKNHFLIQISIVLVHINQPHIHVYEAIITTYEKTTMRLTNIKNNINMLLDIGALLKFTVHSYTKCSV